MQKNDYKRLARAEAMANAQKAELEETLRAAYERACADGNEEEAAACARALRNKLLEKSDAEMTLDRLNFETASATKFIASLVSVLSGAWAKYRKALRDLPEQKGFPFNIDFPKPPNSEEGGEIDGV